MMIWSASTSDFGDTLEDANHALSVLGKEGARLLHHLLVVKAPGEHGGDDDAEHGVKKIVVFPKGIGVVDICDCQNESIISGRKEY